jgi:cytoskeleton protein RodZ
LESFGARFKQERERQQMTLDQVAAATKIGARMLKALEDEHFDQLPGGIFNKGFVRAYARHLGMDEEQAIADYLTATGASQPIREPEVVLAALAAHAESRAAEKSGHGDGLPWEKLAALLLLVALGFALWGWRSRKRAHADQRANPPAAASAPDAMAASPPPSPAVAPSGIESATPASSPPLATQAAPPASPATFLLLVHAHTDSWLEITADGKDVMHEMLAAGAQKSVQAQREIVVKAGNVGGLDFVFNGKKLPSQGASDEVKTLRFDSGGLQGPVAGAHAPPNPA